MFGNTYQGVQRQGLRSSAVLGTSGQITVTDNGDGTITLSLATGLDALVYKGAIDCGTNPNYPAADAGHVYVVSVAGKIGGASGEVVAAGDLILCKVDGSPSGTQAAVGANWDILEHNIDLGNITISGGSISGCNVTVGAGKTLDVSAGTLTLVNDQISGDKVEGGTINAITINTLTTPAITAPSNILVLKPTTDATTAVQVQDKDGNAILTVDTTNDRVGIGTTSPTSPLHGAGATSLGYTTITSSGTAGNYTTYFLNASSGEVILTLPAAATYAGRIYHIVRVQTYPSAYNCIVACQSGEYINGEASLALENNYDRVTAQSNGTGWIILGR